MFFSQMSYRPRRTSSSSRKSAQKRSTKRRRISKNKRRTTLSHIVRQNTSLQKEFEYSIDPYVNFEPNVSIPIYPAEFLNTDV